ncbi:hypothetical protein BDR06DRAFT_1015750 [Suillus hirtellus]|nr:hypothetical protein BDR06DRAFT_1015750 [Suillus hirtellus]
MTERVRPLPLALSQSSSNVPREREDWLIWGLHRISVVLAFLNDSASSTHGNVGPNAIFITPSGEWKLGGFEVLSNPEDDLSVTMGGLMPDAMACAPPEVKKEAQRYQLRTDTLSVYFYTLSSIPLTLHYQLLSLLTHHLKFSPGVPYSYTGMAESDREGYGFFVHNRLVKICAGLDGYTLSIESDKASLLRTLKESASSFPPEFVSYRILPCLASALAAAEQVIKCKNLPESFP